MSNLGLEHALAETGIEFRRAQVGDRHVLAMLNEVGGVLGGETSGHILCLDKTTTGDGLISALQVLSVMKQTGAGLAELGAGMRKYPQVLLNVRVARRFDPLQEPTVVKNRARSGTPLRWARAHRAAGLRNRTRDSGDGGGLRRESGEAGRRAISRRWSSRPRRSRATLAPEDLQLGRRAANLRRLFPQGKCPKVAYASSDGRG